jgi:hypothetical protein
MNKPCPAEWLDDLRKVAKGPQVAMFGDSRGSIRKHIEVCEAIHAKGPKGIMDLENQDDDRQDQNL